jgi:TetR/AcrR family transcriptional regulator, fatty acid metabolism regulator protein
MKSEVAVMEKSERKEREFKARRTEILDQAEKIFAAKGFYKVTMAEIANASGFSIGSLYQFFEGKENLYSSMLSEKLDLMYGQIKENVTATKGIAEKITMIIAAHFQFVENNADFCRLFLRGEGVHLSEVMLSLREKLLDGYYQHLTFIEDELKSGIKSGFLRPLPARDMAEVLFGLIRSSAVDWMLLPAKTSLISKKDFVLEIFLRGVQQNEK